MAMMVIDVRNKLDGRPGQSAWAFAVHRYAVELFMSYIDSMKLNLYSSMEEVGPITEEDLLNGSDSWDRYSRNGNALIWTDDMAKRLLGRPQRSNDECDWLKLQAEALEEAAQLVLSTVNK